MAQAGSGKMALSRPDHQRVTQTVGWATATTFVSLREQVLDETAMVIQAVLFDMGNTLTASTSLAESLAGFAGSQLANGLKLDARRLLQLGQAIEKHIQSLYTENMPGQPHWLEVWQQAANNCNIDLTTDETKWLGHAHLKAFVASCRVQPYSVPVLAFLRKANIPLGLVSNATGPAEVFNADLADKGLASFFQAVVWSCAVGYRKPDPRVFLAALERLELKPGKQIVMVGDNEQADILGGQRLGFTTVKVIEDKRNTESAADYVVKGSDLVRLFQSKLNSTTPS